MTEHKIDLSALRFNIEQGGHSVFSASGSSMWLLCPGSLLPNIAAPETAGEDAAYGTVGHEVGEQWLLAGEPPMHRVGEVVCVRNANIDYFIEIDLEMIEHVRAYVEWCFSTEGDHYVESRVWYSKLTPIPKQGGTADFIAATPGKMKVKDLKMGKGIQVFAADDLSNPASLVIKNGHLWPNGNTQLMLYALGAIYQYDWYYDFEEIEISIAQPRLNHFQTWATTKTELLRFAEWVKERAALAWQPDALRSPSVKACQWCKIKANCAAVVALAHEIADECLDDAGPLEPMSEAKMLKIKEELDVGLYDPKLLRVDNLSTAQIVKIVQFRKVFEGFFNAAEQELELRAIDGEKIPGMKLVESRTNRSWESEERAVAFMKEQGITPKMMYASKMISPAQAEGLLVSKGIKKAEAAKLLSKVARKPPGRATLAPQSDSREALGKAADDCFDVIEDDDCGL